MRDRAPTASGGAEPTAWCHATASGRHVRFNLVWCAECGAQIGPHMDADEDEEPDADAPEPPTEGPSGSARCQGGPLCGDTHPTGASQRGRTHPAPAASSPDAATDLRTLNRAYDAKVQELYEDIVPHSGAAQDNGTPERIERILNGLDAAANRFHDLGAQAEADRRFIGERYEAYKDAGLDFTSASRRARGEFIAKVLAGGGPGDRGANAD